MFAAAVDRITSLFRSSESENHESEHELQRRDSLPRPSGRYTQESSFNNRGEKQPHDVAVNTSLETGYRSDSEDSFDNISLNDVRFDATREREDQVSTVSSIPTVVRLSTLRFENLRHPNKEPVLDRTRDPNGRQNIQVPGSSNYGDTEVGTRIFSTDASQTLPVQMSLKQSHIRGTTNAAFVDDEDSHVTETSDKQTEARKRWSKAVQKQCALNVLETQRTLSPHSEGASILLTKPVVASKLIQSYNRAKARQKPRKASWFEIVRTVQARKISNKLKSVLDSGASGGQHYKQKKYYEEEEESWSEGEHDQRDYYRNPRKKRWWKKHPKTGSERLKQYKFFGKMKI